MSNLPVPPQASYIDRQTLEEVKAGGPAPAPMSMPPMLRFAYNHDQDVVTIEGVTFACDLFRDFGHRMPLEQPIKVVARDDGVLTLVKMEPGDPDWRGETEEDRKQCRTFDSPMLGPSRDPTPGERVALDRAAAETPVALFQVLNRLLNERHLCLVIDTIGGQG
jgi:hypothetical protein